MNLFGKTDIIVTDHRQLLRKAKKLFRKNRLHESISILTKLKHHGFNTDEINLFIARAYDRLAFLTSEVEHEETAIEKYDEIIRYTGSRRYRKRAIKLRNRITDRISSLNESEKKACNRADEMMCNLPKSPKAWFMLGANFPVRKDPVFVINAYINAVKLNENYILALFRIGYLYHYYLKDPDTAAGFYLRLIKIPPYEDTIEPEAVNVKTLLEGCSELSDIYLQRNNMEKIISVFDHAMNIYRTYPDICSPHDIKRIIKNSHRAALSLDKLPALKKHVSSRYNIDLDMIFNELGIN